MNRAEEVDFLAGSLGTPSRTRFRAALIAQGEGCLYKSSVIARSEAMREPALRWPAFLLALEATELRMAGSVALTTPSRFTAEGECWGPFVAIVYPDAERLDLTLEKPARDRVRGTKDDVAELRVKREGPLSVAAVVALKELRDMLQAHLGVVVWLTGT